MILVEKLIYYHRFIIMIHSRLKNLRLLIIKSLNDKKLIEKFQEIFNRL